MTSNKKHRAIRVSFIIIDSYSALVLAITYIADDVVLDFIKNVLQCENFLINTKIFNKYIICGKGDRLYFETSSVCYVCNTNKWVKGKHEALCTDSNTK